MNKKRNCIIFGAGFTGKNAYFKLNLIYHVAGFADNNRSLWGQRIYDVPVLQPDHIKKFDCDVVICSDYFEQIQKQLLDMGITQIRMIEPDSYMLYEYFPDHKLEPVEFPELMQPYKKKSSRMHILFVQQHPCIRTHKIAETLYSRGIDVSIAYTAQTPASSCPGYAGIWTECAAFFSIKDLLDYVNKSEYDLVHSSNEPDSLTGLLLCTNKPVVHDTHDFMSLNYKADRDMLAMEYLANACSHGLLYVNQANLELAEQRFHIDRKKAAVIENRPSETVLPKKYLPKLSHFDHEIHCVYEGGIHKDPAYFRYMEKIWVKLAQSGVHVHFYTKTDPDYCREVEKKHEKIHYEGELQDADLITELTQYDCGLLLFQDLPEYRLILDTALPNKIFEYLMAGLPEVVGNVKSHKQFVEKYKTGLCLDFTKDIREQIAAAAEIPVSHDFILKHQLTMQSQADVLIEFYKKIIHTYKENIQ